MLSRILRDAGVVVAATIGAGIFALPYVFIKAGLWTGIFYLIIMSAVIIFAHILYWRTLESAGGERRLLGFAKNYLGTSWFSVGFVAVVAGLILALVIYIILGGRFLRIFIPSLSEQIAAILFWLASVLPLLFKEKKIVFLETLGALCIAVAIFYIFSGGGWRGFPNALAWDINDLFLPFGVILFSLAGWTAIEPLYVSSQRGGSSGPYWKQSLALGTIASAALYLVFVFGVLGTAPWVAPDTISGFLGVPGWQKFVLAVLGLFAIWTSYEPIALEIKHALQNDLKWKRVPALVFVAFAPLILVFAGLDDFLKVVGLAGGVFLSLQYLLILLVARRVLRLPGFQNSALSVASLVFILGAIYEVYYFVVG